MRLQWENGRNYNASHWKCDENPAGAGAMGSNGKTMRRAMKSNENWDLMQPPDECCSEVLRSRAATKNPPTSSGGR
jgi:hypothetical protein